MIMDWVHCNNCFLLPDREKCFFLTSCGHIFCRDCEEVCAREVCKLCGNQCTSIPLSSSMKPDVQIYFTDPDELLKAKLKEVQKIASFQRNHRARLMTYYRKELVKYRQMKEGFKKILKNLKDLESERKQLSKENDALKKLIEMSGLSRSLSTPHSLVSAPGSHGSRKGISPHFSTPPAAQFNPVFSQYLNKLDSGGSNSAAVERVSVFSPPMNGRIGAIPGTPSPSTAMRALKLNSGHLSGQKPHKSDEKLYSPECSQSSSDYAFNLHPASNTSSPLETWNGPKNSSNMAYQYKRDPKRVVVHPYSPVDE